MHVLSRAGCDDVRRGYADQYTDRPSSKLSAQSCPGRLVYLARDGGSKAVSSLLYGLPLVLHKRESSRAHAACGLKSSANAE